MFRRNIQDIRWSGFWSPLPYTA